MKKKDTLFLKLVLKEGRGMFRMVLWENPLYLVALWIMCVRTRKRGVLVCEQRLMESSNIYCYNISFVILSMKHLSTIYINICGIYKTMKRIHNYRYLLIYKKRSGSLFFTNWTGETRISLTFLGQLISIDIVVCV